MGALDEFSAAIDRARAAGAQALSDGESLVQLNVLRSQLEALICEATTRFEDSGAYALDGARTATAWLATTTRLPEQTIRRDLRVGRAMRALPTAAAAFAAGELNGSHVALLGPLARGRCAEALREGEALLVDKARELRFTAFERAVKYFEQLADPDGSEEKAEERRARRNVTLGRSIGGTWFGQMTLDGISGEIVRNELDAIESELYQLDSREASARLGRPARPTELSRTSAQRRADALTEMARRSASALPGAPRQAPLFTVLVGWETLRGRILELASRAVLTPGSLLPYLDEAILERAVFSPGKRVEVGVRRRLFDGATRRAIEVRDQRCAHPFCDQPASRCEIDHIVPYSAGGLTIQENGEPRCGFHNDGRWTDWLDLPPEERQRIVREHLARFAHLLDGEAATAGGEARAGEASAGEASAGEASPDEAPPGDDPLHDPPDDG